MLIVLILIIKFYDIHIYINFLVRNGFFFFFFFFVILFCFVSMIQ